LKRRDSLFLTLISRLSRRATNQLTLVRPSTLLDWQRRFTKNFWSYKHKTSGRKPVTKDIKKLILQMKQENQLWGCHRIADELKKIGMELNPTTVNRIIQTFRKQGKIRREALDHFLLFSEKQVRKIIKEYVEYYNHHRPHQETGRIPEGVVNSTTGIIKTESILGGLHHNYYRSSA
jgi:hypothetical protein